MAKCNYLHLALLFLARLNGIMCSQSENKMESTQNMVQNVSQIMVSGTSTKFLANKSNAGNSSILIGTTTMKSAYVTSTSGFINRSTEANSNNTTTEQPHPTKNNTKVTRRCSEKNSIIITKYESFNNGSILDLDSKIVYPQEFFWKDEGNSSKIHGCICSLKTCIQKCCPKGQMYGTNGNCTDSTPEQLRMFNVDFMNKLNDSEIALYTNTEESSCPSKAKEHFKVPGRFTLLRNGELSVPKMRRNFSFEEFCVEFLEDSKQASLLVCRRASSIPRTLQITFANMEEVDIATSVVYPTAMILSSFFLIATFIVYAVLPELRNLHGKCLMSHVASLVTNFVFLSTVQIGKSRFLLFFCHMFGTVQGPEFLWYVPDVLNALQGVVFFIIFVCKQRIRRLLTRRFFPKLAGSCDIRENKQPSPPCASSSNNYSSSGTSISTNDQLVMKHNDIQDKTVPEEDYEDEEESRSLIKILLGKKIKTSDNSHINWIDNKTEACNKLNSVIINKFRHKQNGSLLDLESFVTYPGGFYWRDTQENSTEIRGCICLLKKCIRKCCPEGHILTDEGDCSVSVHTPSFILPLFDEHTFNLVHYTKRDRHILYGHPCPGYDNFILGEKYFLLQTGKLYLPVTNEYFTAETYCLEFSESSNKIVPVICLDESLTMDEEVTSLLDTTLYRIGMIVSLFFLFATFMVYSILRELKNLHGMCLMSYVASLFVSFLLLTVVNFKGQDISDKLCISFEYEENDHASKENQIQNTSELSSNIHRKNTNELNTAMDYVNYERETSTENFSEISRIEDMLYVDTFDANIPTRNYSSDQTSSCNEFNSVVIIKYTLLDNGSLFDSDTLITYPPGLFWNHVVDNRTEIRGCICLIRSCYRKCCLEGFALSMDDELHCLLSNHSLLLSFEINFTNDNSFDLQYSDDQYYQFYGINCPEEHFILNPEYYEYSVLKNGQLEVTAKESVGFEHTTNYSTDQYCMEVIEDLNLILPLICFPENLTTSEMPLEDEVQMTIYAIGTLLSLPFLLATFLVYAVFKELWNLQGMCLLCYVGCLFLAFTFLGITNFGSSTFSFGFCYFFGIDEPTIEKSPITPTPEPITEIPQDNSTSSDNIGINTTIGTDMTSNTERSLMDIEKNNTFVVSDESSTSENISTEVLRNCSKISTATIINYQNFDNGSLLDLDGMIIYPPGYYWSDENNSSKIYGCICLLKTCVRKCCAKGEIMDKRGQCVNKIKLYQPFTLQFMNEKTLGAESLVDYHVLYMKSCPEDKDWLVNPREYTEDSHYLLKNGQLYVPQLMKNFTVEEFCMEVFEDVNSTFPLICPVQSDSPIRSEDVHKIYSITTVEASDLEGDNDTEVRHNCSKISSATIINYQYFDNGSLLDEDSMIVYPPGYYWEDDNSTEIYGCICLLKTCVRKCCSIDQAMDKDGECINQTEIVHPFKLQFIHEETLGLESSVDHHVLHGKPCPALGYRLENPGDFPEDIHYLLRNGDLYVPQLMQNFTVEEFCMETFEDEHINLPLICVENESNEPMESDVQMILYPIGMILSIPFLMATFLVYIALPKLRNLHGMCLMAYVGGLFVGYIFLSIVQLGGLVISAEFCIGCVTTYERFENGSLLATDRYPMMYPEGMHWEDIDEENNTIVRGCFCVLANCIRKCCPENMTHSLKEEGGCVNSSNDLLYPFKPQFIDFETRIVVKNLTDEIHVVYGDPCPIGGYRIDPLDPDSPEEFFLLPNGTLRTNDESFSVGQYCLEAFDDVQRILPLACFPVEDEETRPVIEDPNMYVLYPIGMIISMPFLLATFCVYAMIPELRNLHGKSLMCHVTTLFVGYVFLAIVQIGGDGVFDGLCVFSEYYIPLLKGPLRMCYLEKVMHLPSTSLLTPVSSGSTSCALTFGGLSGE
ncbi:hypothetical protein C0J52_22283 [Blattella germanica]|nr:hypothetical protein C0J52_22283 [Blattella germanica]